MYSWEPVQCRVALGSYAEKQQPSINTYEKLRQQIAKIQTGICNVEELKEWKDWFVDEQLVYNLRNVFNTQDADGNYVASYLDIYRLISNYFGYGTEMTGYEPGEYYKKITNRYYEVNLTYTEPNWYADKTFSQIKAAIKNNYIPIIKYQTEEDWHYGLYQYMKDDDIVFTESVIYRKESDPNTYISFVNFSISELESAATQVRRETIQLSDISTDGFEQTSNKIVDIVEERLSPTLYTSEKAVVNYVLSKIPALDDFELLANKKNVIEATTKQSSEYYPTINAVTSYIDAQNFETDINKKSAIEEAMKQSTEYYPSVKAMTDYIDDQNFETDTNKKSAIEEAMKQSTEYYPSIKAVVDYCSSISGLNFDGGFVSKDKVSGGEEKEIEAEIIASITAATEDRIDCQLSKAHDILEVSAYYVEETNTLLTGTSSNSTGTNTFIVNDAEKVEVPITHWTTTGAITLDVSESKPETGTRTIYADYTYEDSTYKYRLHLYQDTARSIEVPATDYTPIDLSVLSTGGGGGTGFDTFEISEEADGRMKLNFYFEGVLISSGYINLLQPYGGYVTPANGDDPATLMLTSWEVDEEGNHKDYPGFNAIELTGVGGEVEEISAANMTILKSSI